MASNKERIESIEQGLGAFQDTVSQLEMGMADKLCLIEENLQRLTDTVLSSREGSFSNLMGQLGPPRTTKDDGPQQIDTTR